MRNALLLFTLFGAATVAGAQTSAPAAPTDKSLYISEAQMQSIIDGVPAKDGKPAAFSKRLFEASTYSTALIRLTAPDQPHAHGTWSEIFVVREGSGIVETGGTITGKVGTDSATHRDIFVGREQATPEQQKAAAEAAAASAARRAAQGDKSGTDIEGGVRQAVKAGDIVLIPAGVAHRWVQVDKAVVYLDVKFPKAQ